MTDIGVGLDKTKHCETVHLRHHHVADHQRIGIHAIGLVLLGQQLFEALTTITANGDVIISRQLLANVASQLLVVVNNKHTVVRLRLRGIGQTDGAGLLSHIIKLVGSQMGLTLRQAHREHAALRTVCTVVGRDGTMMHIDYHLTEVQADARTFDMR